MRKSPAVRRLSPPGEPLSPAGSLVGTGEERNQYVSRVAQLRSAPADRSLFRAELALLVIGAVVVLVTAFAAGGGDVAAWEASIFRAINDLPDLLYAPVWVVMQF